MTLPGSVRLLMVEDVATDAEMEIRELRRAGLRVEHLLVDTEDAFRLALEGFAPDIVISDFSMPHFDGMAALAIVRELRPDLPFLFVSGTIGEEYAIRALKNGATDYVLKSNLVRLPSAVERALLERDERAARREAESMFRDVLNNAPDPMIVVDPSGAIVLANGEAAKVFGFAPAGLLGANVDDLIPEGLRGRHAAHRAGFMATPARRNMVARLPLVARRRDGQEFPVEISLAPLGGQGRAMVIATIRDLTERRTQEERIARLGRIRDLLGAANSAFMRMLDRKSLFEEFCNIAATRGGFAVARIVELDGAGQLSIAATTEAAPRLFREIVDEFNRDPARAGGLLGNAIRTRQVMISNDVRNDQRVARRSQMTADQNYSLGILPVCVGETVVAAAVLRAGGADFFDQEELALLSEMVGNLEFALELQDKQARVNYLAFYDPLTGLPNRTFFMERLSQALESERRNSGSLTLVTIDLERFKAINDVLGQSIGDAVLREAGRRMQEATRDIDRVARLGGNLFALIFAGMGGAQEAARRIERHSAQVFAEPYRVEGHEIRVAAKAGIAVFPDDGADVATLFRNAEAALKRAKETGERYLFYAPQINARISEQVELENRLRKAVERGELFLHYQPKVDLATRAIVGVEALMRWQGPDGQLVSPARFIPVLEETGLILEAGRHALRLAAQTYGEWRAKLGSAPRVAVNVSARQIRHGDFVDDVRAAACAAEVGVDLEITESLLMQDVESSMRKLSALREAGLRVALDDFGTGHSSLAYLSRLPIDTLKIDRSFVHGMLEKAEDTGIVTAIISLAQALRVGTVAEGVETEEQARLLRLLRCDQMQGYLFSPPLPKEKMEALLAGAGV